MSKSNKLGITISVMSVLVIGGAIYYYNANTSKSNEKISQTQSTVIETTTAVTTTKNELKLNEKNVKISTEIKDENTAIVSLENLAERNLTELIVEVSYKENKIAEVLIPILEKGAIKKMEVPLGNKLESLTIKNVPELTSNFRMIESVEFLVGDNKGEVLVSSLKAQEKEFYIEKVEMSSLEQSLKDELIKKIESAKTIEEIEKLLKENKIIEEINLSSDHIVFKDGEEELKVESNAILVETNTAVTTSDTSISSEISSTRVNLVQQSITTKNSSNITDRVQQPSPATVTTSVEIYGYVSGPPTSTVNTTNVPVVTTMSNSFVSTTVPSTSVEVIAENSTTNNTVSAATGN